MGNKQTNNDCVRRDTCRICGNSELFDIISLGDLYVSNFVDSPEALGDEKPYPLELVLCNAADGGCGLVQLRHTVSPQKMYRQYWYLSGVNTTMMNALTELAQTSEKIARLNHGDIIIDIGSNDGTTLKAFQTPGLRLVGFEPATNIVNSQAPFAEKIYNDFFNAAAFEKDFGGAKAKLVTAIAMFYDLDDPNTFVADVAKLLAPDGVFVIQQAYLPLMLKQNNFDNIMHEHIEYYSLYSLEQLLHRHDLEVFDVEENDVNGASFRTYIRHRGSVIGGDPNGVARVQVMRDEETKLGLHTAQPYTDFGERVRGMHQQLVSFVKDEVANGKVIHAYGASSKGNTILQFLGLNESLIAAAAERNPMKWGKRTIGSNIPIISEEDSREANPDYYLALPWHFLPEFLKREVDFLKRGGKFIVPVPAFQVIGAVEAEAGGEAIVSIRRATA